MSTLQWLLFAWACGAGTMASSLLLIACEEPARLMPAGAGEWLAFASVCIGWPLTLPLAALFALAGWAKEI